MQTIEVFSYFLLHRGIAGDCYGAGMSATIQLCPAARNTPVRFSARSFGACGRDESRRFVNPAVETGSTNHLFGHRLPTMIRCSDAAIARGSKAPNQPSDGLASTRVGPGLPCLRTSCA